MQHWDQGRHHRHSINVETRGLKINFGIWSARSKYIFENGKPLKGDIAPRRVTEHLRVVHLYRWFVVTGVDPKGNALNLHLHPHPRLRPWSKESDRKYKWQKCIFFFLLTNSISIHLCFSSRKLTLMISQQGVNINKRNKIENSEIEKS